ncbi:MAG: CvpA family protein [Rikenellaceae bacterium]
MNIIDIIIIACLVISLILGFKDGAIRQLGTLIGIVVAIFLAKTFGGTVSEVLGIKGDYALIWGYAIVLLVTLIGVGLIATLLRKIFSAVGLGALDRVAGAALSLLKTLIILTLVLSLFNFINNTFEIVDKKTTASSKLYEPIVAASRYILPAIDWVEDQLPTTTSKE